MPAFATVNKSTYSTAPISVEARQFAFVDAFGNIGPPVSIRVTTSIVVGS